MPCGSPLSMAHQVSKLSGKPAPTLRTSCSTISPTRPCAPGGGALAAHGSMALAMLDKYAPDPDFREILHAHGAAIIPADRPGRHGAGGRRLAPGYPDGRLPSHSPWPPCSPPARTAKPRSGRSRTMASTGRPAERDSDPVLPVPPSVRRDPSGQRAAPGPFADLERDDLGADRRLFRGGRRLEPGGHPARGCGRRRGDPVRGQGCGSPRGPLRGRRAERGCWRVGREALTRRGPATSPCTWRGGGSSGRPVVSIKSCADFPRLCPGSALLRSRRWSDRSARRPESD